MWASRAWCALCALLLCLIPLGAAADELLRYETSLYGPERLRLFALTRIFDGSPDDPDVRLALRRDLERQGHYQDGAGPRILRHGVSVYPVLGYDDNINGGVLNDRFRFSGLVFEADPTIRAKAGLVAGGGFGTQTRVAIARGTYVDLTGAADFAYSPTHQISRSQAEIAACLRSNLTGWTFVDLCQRFEDTERELGRSTRRVTSVALSSLHQTGHAYHEAQVQLERAYYTTIDQDAVTLGLRSVIGRVLPSVSLSLAGPVPDEIAYRSRVNVGFQMPHDGRLYGIYAWRQYAEGGMFLGTEREDRTFGLGVSADLQRNITVSLTYSNNRSTAAFFNYSQLEMQVRFREFRW